MDLCHLTFVTIYYLAQAILPTATRLRSVVCLSVCLSVVCHIRAPCLNRSTDLDAIMQVHCGMQGHTVLDGGVPDPEGEGRDFGSNPAAQMCNYKLLLPPGE